MIIDRVIEFKQDALTTRLRMINMKEDTEAFPYKDAQIEYWRALPEHLVPAQRYVLKKELYKVQELAWALEKYGVDLFNLEGFMRIWSNGSNEPIDLLPPIVEGWIEEDGHKVDIINDGMHRVLLARLCHKKIKIAHISHIPQKYPYYAYPISGDHPWDAVQMIDSIPIGFTKKWYRTEEPKKLYRDFNSAFESVGASRGYDTHSAQQKASEGVHTLVWGGLRSIGPLNQ